MKDFMKDPIFVPYVFCTRFGCMIECNCTLDRWPQCRQYDIDLRKEREVSLTQLQALCRAGFISVLDFRNNPLRIFAAHECAAMCGDGSLSIKMTVQVMQIRRHCKFVLVDTSSSIPLVACTVQIADVLLACAVQPVWWLSPQAGD